MIFLLIGTGLAFAIGPIIGPLRALAQVSATRSAVLPASASTLSGKMAKRHAKSGSNSASAQAAASDSPSPFSAFENSKNRGPVNIQSDALALDYKNNAVLFTGKVHAVQADGQLTSNTLNVKYGKDFHEVQEMVADGDVHLSQGLRWCTSTRAVMNQAAHTVVLTGSPICHDAKDEISGTRITVHTDSGKSEVDGPGVKALIFPQESKTRDNIAARNHAN